MTSPGGDMIWCEICGERFNGEPRAEVIDTQSPYPPDDMRSHLICHAEPCSYEHGARYKLA